MSLIAVLKTRDLSAIVKECEIPLDKAVFTDGIPDMIELEKRASSESPHATVRQFFRIGISSSRAFYREGFSYRVSE